MPFIEALMIAQYGILATIEIFLCQGRNHDFHFGGGKAVTTILILKGGLEVTIGGGLTMVEAEELRKFYDFQTSKHAITGHTLG